MEFALVVTCDDEVFSRSRDNLRSLCLNIERAKRDIEAYRRIASLPTLDVVIVDVNSGITSAEVAQFAKQVLPNAEVLLLK